MFANHATDLRHRWASLDLVRHELQDAIRPPLLKRPCGFSSIVRVSFLGRRIPALVTSARRTRSRLRTLEASPAQIRCRGPTPCLAFSVGALQNRWPSTDDSALGFALGDTIPIDAQACGESSTRIVSAGGGERSAIAAPRAHHRNHGRANAPTPILVPGEPASTVPLRMVSGARSSGR